MKCEFIRVLPSGKLPCIQQHFNWPNPSIRIMALGPTQLLTEMRSRNLPAGQRAADRCVRLTTLPPSVSRLSTKMWEPQRLTTQWASTACYRDTFNFFLPYKKFRKIRIFTLLPWRWMQCLTRKTLLSLYQTTMCSIPESSLSQPQIWQVYNYLLLQNISFDF
jgi:hypothetical protein